MSDSLQFMSMTLKEANRLLVLCDKLCPSQSLDLGAYLVVCAYHNPKPTVGTAFIPFRPLATAAAGRGSPLNRTTAAGDYDSTKTRVWLEKTETVFARGTYQRKLLTMADKP